MLQHNEGTEVKFLHINSMENNNKNKLRRNSVLPNNVAAVLSKVSGLSTGRTKAQPTTSNPTESHAC